MGDSAKKMGPKRENRIDVRSQGAKRSLLLSSSVAALPGCGLVGGLAEVAGGRWLAVAEAVPSAELSALAISVAIVSGVRLETATSPTADDGRAGIERAIAELTWAFPSLGSSRRSTFQAVPAMSARTATAPTGTRTRRDRREGTSTV